MEVNDEMVNMQNVGEDDKFLKCEDNKEVFVQEKSLKDTSMKIFKLGIESEVRGDVDTMNLEVNTEDGVELLNFVSNYQYLVISGVLFNIT